MASETHGSTMKHITRPALLNYRVTIPVNPNEQGIIADILSTVDEAIAQSEALVRKYQSIKQGLMSDLLTRGVDENGELRPTREEAPDLYRESPLGWLPKEWEAVELKTIASVERGKFTPRPRNNPKYYNGEHPFIQTGEVAAAGGRRINTYTQTLNELGASVSREFPRETIVVTIAANIGETAILDIPMYVTDSLVGIVVRQPNNVRYVETFIRSKKEYFNAVAPQSAQKNINLGDLRPMLIAKPKPIEQDKIAEIYDFAESVLMNEESNLTKLQLLKQGLMQDLLSGQVRVKV
jgi:type I restriction enzyme S subunit